MEKNRLYLLGRLGIGEVVLLLIGIVMNFFLTVGLGFVLMVESFAVLLMSLLSSPRVGGAFAAQRQVYSTEHYLDNSGRAIERRGRVLSSYLVILGLTNLLITAIIVWL